MTVPFMSHQSITHLVFKTHLDLGFTGLAGTVLNQYLHIHIPRALRLAKEFRNREDGRRFVWTTGSWLVREFLEQRDAAARAEMEEAIIHDEIQWHGLPFTTHTELMDEPLFEYGLSLAGELDRTFGKKTVAAKMTDVPGHTRAMVPALARSGIRFLHIGVNPSSSAPNVPPVFLWRDPESGAEIVVAYSSSGYGDLVELPGETDRLAFAHTGDNLGPQSEEEVHREFDYWLHRTEGSCIRADGLNGFGSLAWGVRARLPVIESEIGDTWIHGIGSDPWKVSRFLTLQRWRTRKIESSPALSDDLQFRKFSDSLLLVAEHTWGRDVKFWTHRQAESAHHAVIGHYRREAFHEDVRKGLFYEWEASWEEQRRYLDAAVAALDGSTLQDDAKEALALCDVDSERREGETAVDLADLDSIRRIGGWQVGFDPTTGAIVHLQRGNLEAVADPAHPLGVFRYETFTGDDVRKYHHDYTVNHEKNGHWSWPDFGKPGLDLQGIDDKIAEILTPQAAWVKSNDLFTEVRLVLQASVPAVASFGCPSDPQIIWRFPHQAAEPVEVEVSWQRKQICRIPEAAWFSFRPKVGQTSRWTMKKMGRKVCPTNVVVRGNRSLHAVQAVEHPVMDLVTLDAPLVAPGSRRLYMFTMEHPDLNGGWHFNLLNNKWGTNFPFWIGGAAKFRFQINLHARSSNC